MRRHLRGNLQRREPISIHAPTWGATYECCSFCVMAIFQSTHPRGVRPIGGWLNATSGQISIHAPTWGATEKSVSCGPNRKFQSTHPRGVRHGGEAEVARYDRISIHAPTWGATLCQHRFVFLNILFQSTHPRGVRHLTFRMRIYSLHFNPRTHVGCDHD